MCVDVLPVVRPLLLRGADFHATNDFGWTALMDAAWSGHPSVATMLLKWGMDPDAQDEDGVTVQVPAVTLNRMCGALARAMATASSATRAASSVVRMSEAAKPQAPSTRARTLKPRLAPS